MAPLVAQAGRCRAHPVPVRRPVAALPFVAPAVRVLDDTAPVHLALAPAPLRARPVRPRARPVPVRRPVAELPRVAASVRPRVYAQTVHHPPLVELADVGRPVRPVHACARPLPAHCALLPALALPCGAALRVTLLTPERTMVCSAVVDALDQILAWMRRVPE